MEVVLFGPRPEDGRHEIQRRLDASQFEVAFGRATPESLGGSSCFVPLNLSDYDDLEFCEKYSRKKFLAPHKRTVALCHDKLEFNRFLLEKGFGANIPRYHDGTIACRPKFPYLLKKRRSNWGLGSSIILSAEDQALKKVAEKLGTGDYFIQECIFGSTEYALHILADQGEVLFHSTVVYTAPEQIYIKGHGLELEECRVDSDNEFIQLFERIIRELHYTGTCCFDYKVVAGCPMIFELNPRFGGSLQVKVSEYLYCYLNYLRKVSC